MRQQWLVHSSGRAQRKGRGLFWVFSASAGCAFKDEVGKGCDECGVCVDGVRAVVVEFQVGRSLLGFGVEVKDDFHVVGNKADGRA